MKHTPNIVQGYIYIGLALLSTAVFSLIADGLFREFSTLHAANLLFWSISWAVLIATPFFLLQSHLRKNIFSLLKNQYQQLILIWIVSFVGATLWNFWLQASSAGIISLLWKSTFLMTVFLGVIFLREKINIPEIIALIVVVIWLISVANLQGEVHLLAVVYILLSCSCYAILSLLIKNLWNNVDMKCVAYLRAVSVAVCLFFFLLITGDLSVPTTKILVLWSLSELFWIILWAIFYFEAHRHLPISKLNVFSVSDVIFMPIIAYFVFWDQLTLEKWLWMFLIFIGLVSFMKLQTQQKH